MLGRGERLIWLIGGKGMLGTELSLLLEKSGLPFTATDREVDITNPDALLAFVSAWDKNARSNGTRSTQGGYAQNGQIRWIINCAAYTAVDKAEDDRENCRLLNTVGAGNAAVTARKIGARLIHISTDYVFNGRGTRPYTEEDPACPIGVYGLTKREGEIRVLEEHPRSYIIRTAWLYGKYGNNFVNTMLRLMRTQSEVKVVHDQRGSPTWAFDLARAIIAFIRTAESGGDVPYGIYHFTDEGSVTWFDFAREIYAQGRALGMLTKDCDVTPCTSADFPAKVKRPEYSVLDKRKIMSILGIAVPSWNESLRDYFRSVV